MKDDAIETLRDLDEALRIAGGSRELVDDLFAQFCAELPGRMAVIEELSVTGDRQGLREALHQLKGGAAVCAVKPFLAVLEELHQAARSGGSVGLEPLLAKLRDCAEALLAATAD